MLHWFRRRSSTQPQPKPASVHPPPKPAGAQLAPGEIGPNNARNRAYKQRKREAKDRKPAESNDVQTEGEAKQPTKVPKLSLSAAQGQDAKAAEMSGTAKP